MQHGMVAQNQLYKQVKAVKKAGIPVKTQEQNTWAGSIWHGWARYRQNILPTEKEKEENNFKEDLPDVSSSNKLLVVQVCYRT